jgi:hypothetical protein
VNGREFPRLQLRGSAGFAPASHSSGVRPGYDLRKPILRKSKKYSLANLAGGTREVKRVSLIILNESNRANREEENQNR